MLIICLKHIENCCLVSAKLFEDVFMNGINIESIGRYVGFVKPFIIMNL